MQAKEIADLFDRIKKVDYGHREGGRYAYVQLMALIRDLSFEIRQGFPGHSCLGILFNAGEMLNALVALPFGKEHRIIFDLKIKELAELEAEFLQAEVGLSQSQVEDAA